MSKTSHKFLKISLSFLISGIFCYFAFRGIDFRKVLGLIRNVDPLYVGAIVLIVVLTQILRSVRWAVLLHPMESVNQKVLFPITSIGFMFIVLLPARLGEVVRPYLLQQNSRINFSSAMATVIMERILDFIFILLLFGVSISFINPPKWIIDVGKFSILVLLLITGILIAGGLKKTQKNVDKIIHIVFPVRLACLASKLMKSFYSGMSVLGKRRHLLITIMLSMVIWAVSVLVNWLLFRALGMNLGTLAAIYVLALTMLGISVPAGPGFIGNYHFACVLALGFFNVGKEMAIGYALFLHIITIGTLLLLGFLCLSLSRVNMSVFSKKVIFEEDRLLKG